MSFTKNDFCISRDVTIPIDLTEMMDYVYLNPDVLNLEHSHIRDKCYAMQNGINWFNEKTKDGSIQKHNKGMYSKLANITMFGYRLWRGGGKWDGRYVVSFHLKSSASSDTLVSLINDDIFVEQFNELWKNTTYTQ